MSWHVEPAQGMTFASEADEKSLKEQATLLQVDRDPCREGAVRQACLDTVTHVLKGSLLRIGSRLVESVLEHRFQSLGLRQQLLIGGFQLQLESSPHVPHDLSATFT